MYYVVQRSIHSRACIIKVREPSLTANCDNNENSSLPSSQSLARQSSQLKSPMTTTFLQQAFVLTRLRQYCDDLIVRDISFITIY
ncbi:unnamed protein product [Cercopithifilaria johnstoni]|uniref:Uncharacterized protein n=1 Tax=Cercopithifilaria johnstoni TaxID=2874296 RepID=A0A8J2MCG2_9BILA|nr:unnamed protein product [Cercopithifilaria johnstoni]